MICEGLLIRFVLSHIQKIPHPVCVTEIEELIFEGVVARGKMNDKGYVTKICPFNRIIVIITPFKVFDTVSGWIKKDVR